MLFWLLKIFISIPLMILCPTKVIGRKNLPKKGGAIEICNHWKLFDPVFISVYQWRRPRFLAKKEIFKGFFLKCIFKDLGAIPIDRKNVNMSGMKKVVRTLKDGKIVLIFPEGTRNKGKDDSIQELKNGVSAFALMAKVPIIPMYIQKKIAPFRFNRIFIGEPIDFSEFFNTKPTPELLESLGGIVTSKMNELKDCSLNYKNRKKESKAAHI